MTTTDRDKKISVAKDLVLFIGGLAGIGYQQVTQNVNPYLLLVFSLMAGIPGVTNLIMLIRGSPTDTQSLSSPPTQQEQDSQNV